MVIDSRKRLEKCWRDNAVDADILAFYRVVRFRSVGDNTRFGGQEHEPLGTGMPGTELEDYLRANVETEKSR
jgi:hypothetical protein